MSNQLQDVINALEARKDVARDNIDEINRALVTLRKFMSGLTGNGKADGMRLEVTDRVGRPVEGLAVTFNTNGNTNGQVKAKGQPTNLMRTVIERAVPGKVYTLKGLTRLTGIQRPSLNVAMSHLVRQGLFRRTEKGRYTVTP